MFLHLGRLTLALSLLASLLGVVLVAQAPPATAAPLACTGNTLYIADADGNVYSVNAATGASTGPTYDATPGATATPNQLGVSQGGATAVNTNSTSIVEYDGNANTTTSVAKQTATGINTVAGGVNPVTGIYYYGGYNAAGTTFTAWAYNPATNITTGPVLQVTMPGGSEVLANGDLAFDQQGRMYLVQSSAMTSRLVRVNGTVPTSTPQQTLTSETISTTSVTAPTNGMAFGSDGFLYLSTTSAIRRVNPATGASTGSVSLSGAAGIDGITDLASCSVPSTLQLQKSLPNGRLAAGDQFGLALTGGGLTSGNAGTTQGAETGLQNQSAGEVAGPVVAVPGTTYTLTETASGTTNLGNYVKSWQCVNAAGTVLSSGSGASGTITMPDAAGSQVTCTFTNRAPRIELEKTADPTTFDRVGQTVTYSFAVSNTGGVALNNLSVDDGLARVTTPTCAPVAQGGTLPSGSTTTCTARLTTTQQDLDAGTPIVNTATASGTPTGANPVSDTDDATITPTVRATIGLEKSASRQTFTRAGQTITYDFAVTNTGNVPLTNVVVDDGLARVSTPTCAPVPQGGNLAVGGTTTCTATLTTTQADVDSGAPIVNTATVSGSAPSGARVSDSDDATVTADATGSLAVDKSASPTTFDSAGRTITYTFVVRNTGSQTLSDLSVRDEKPGVSTPVCSPVAQGGSLAPDATTTCTATYTTTQADVDAGSSIVNTVTATAARPGGGTASATDDATITPLQSPSVDLEKTADPATVTRAGQRVDYRFTVRNTGNVTLSDLGVDDGMAGVSTPTCAPVAQGGSLAPGASTTCTAAYTVTQADLDAGTPVVNVATATGTRPGGGAVSDTDDATVTPVQVGGLALTKSADPAVVDRVGQVVDYTFAVTNTGNVTLTRVEVADGMVGVSTPTCAPVAQGGSLAPGASTTCTAAYTVTQADLDAGNAIVNTATATATRPGGAVVTSTDDATVTPAQAPRLALDKTAGDPVDVNDSGITDAGDTIAYSFVVTNQGNVTVGAIAVDDPRAGAVTCEETSLAPGQSTACVADAPYVITEDDETRGLARNTATAEGAAPGGGAVESDPDTTNTPVTATSAVLTLDKVAAAPIDVNDSGITDAGDRIPYTFTVTNDGNVRLRDVTVIDPLLPGLTCPTGVLSPGGSLTCDGTYTVTEADEAGGAVLNTARARAQDPDGVAVTSNTDSTRTPTARPAPSLALDKMAGDPVDRNGSGITDAGDTITFTFTVTNTGNVPMRQLTIEDTLVEAVCDQQRLAPGESTVCTAPPYVVTADDEGAGSVLNTAAASAVDPDGARVESVDDSTGTPVSDPAPALDVEKRAADPVDVNRSGITDAGDTIAYSFVVTNVGNVPVGDVRIADPRAPPVTCDVTTLNPGQSTSCATLEPYVVTEGDEAAGSVLNTATAVATDPDGDPVRSPEDTTSTPVTTPMPVLDLDKAAAAPDDVNDSGITDAGDTIAYSFVLTNTGNVPLSGVEVVDDLAGPVTCQATSLEPGASTSCLAEEPYVVTEADERAGSVLNTARSSAVDPDADTVRSASDSTVTGVVSPRASLSVDKVAGSPVDVNGSGITDAGDTVAYSFTVTNEGNVPLSAVAVIDDLAGPVTCEALALAPGASTECVADATYVVTEADEAAGAVVNTATAGGTEPDGARVTSAPDSTRTRVVPPQPLLLLEKSADDPVDVNDSGITDAGDTIRYSFTVTNAGNVPLAGIEVDDDLAGSVTCEALVLAPGASTECVADAAYVVTSADEESGVVLNTATTTGTDPDGGQVISDPDSTATPVTRSGAALVLDKTAGDPVDVNGSGLTDAGDTVRYTFTVTNTGNVPVDDVAVVDPRAGAVTCDAARLAPGASTSCAADEAYVVTSADEADGAALNTATATGIDPDDEPVVSPEDSTTTPVTVPAPLLVLDKRAADPVDVNGSGITDAGDTVRYTFILDNVGNVPLRTPSVTDPRVGAVNCPSGPLAPGESVVCEAAELYVVTEADEAAGSVDNTAGAAADDPDGERVSAAPDSTSTPVTSPVPLVVLDKQAAQPVDVNLSGITDARDTIAYTFTVTNVGNVPLTDLTVSDALIGPVTCARTTLPAGESTTCAADNPYVVTEADEVSGSITNTATAVTTEPDGATVVSAPDSTATSIQRGRPLLSLEKTAATPVDVDGNGITDAGDTIAYTFVVTNKGNVPIRDLDIDDPQAGGVTCSQTVLAPGAEVTCAADDPYVITAADEDERVARNTAVATGLDPDGEVVTSPSDTTAIDVTEPDPILTLEKVAGEPTDRNDSGLVDAGDTIAYTFTVANTGNVPIEVVGVEDPLLGAITCAPVDLLPGESAACTAAEPYVVTTDDELDGSVVNTAVPTGIPNGGVLVSVPDSSVTGVDRPTPLVTLDKRAGAPVDVNDSGITDAGDTVSYTFTVTNVGNVPLRQVVVTDDLLGDVTCAATALAPGAATECTAAPYTITAADEVTGFVDNTASAAALDPDDEPIDSEPDSTTTPVGFQSPGLSVDKSAGAPVDVNGSGITDAGDTIAYTFTVTNTGNVPVDDVVVSDPLVGEVTCPETRLPVGASTTCTADQPYVVSEADESAGVVRNTAGASGSDPDDEPVTAAVDSTATPVSTPNPVLVLEKTASPPVDTNDSGITDAGDTISYTFTVTNVGNVPISAVDVDDARVPDVECAPAELAPGQSAECAAPAYVVTETDEAAGAVDNTASATGRDPDAGPVVSAPDSTSTPVTSPSPVLTLEKRAGDPVDVNSSGLTDAGDTIGYTFTLTNEGNVPVVGVGVVDDLVGTVSCEAGRLAPGESTRCVADTDYVVTAADETAGRVHNTAAAVGTDPDGGQVGSPPASTTTPVSDPAPALQLAKTAATPVDVNDSGLVDAGDTVAYTFTVTNVGNVPVGGIAIDDPLVGPVTCDAARLAPGERALCTADAAYVVTDADERAGVVLNTATATGTDPDGAAVASPVDSTSTGVDSPAPRLSLDKTAGTPLDVNGSGLVDAGDTIAYTFTVTNTGNVPLAAVVVEDDLAGPVTCVQRRLAPGESTECDADEAYVVTTADEAAGSVVNTATAVATDPDDERVEADPDSTTTPVSTPRPSLSLDKTAGTPVDVNDSGLVDAGDTIAYTFTVTNDGNVPVSAVAITDPMLGQVTCEASLLAPGGSTTCAAPPYTVVGADESAGSVANSATAEATDPDGDRVSATDSTTTPVDDPQPRLGIDKSAGSPVDVNDSGLVDAGDTIRYSFTVTNDGNVPVRGVEVVDPMLTAAGIAVTCEASTVAPGASTSCVADAAYVVTEGDELAGTVTNSAIAAGTDPDGASVESTADRTTTPVDQPAPALSIDKAAGDPVDVNDSGITDTGDTIRYSFTVTNDGNVPVRDVEVIDPLLADAGIAVTCEPTVLTPGESATCTTSGPYTVTAADEERTVVTNTATATGTDPDDGRVDSDPDSTSTPVTASAAVLSLEKVAAAPVDVNGSGITDAGDTIAYTFTVTNEGNVPVSAISVDDPRAGAVTCEAVRLAPGESTPCSADVDYVVTEDDEGAGEARNTALARGSDPDDEPVASAEDQTTTLVVAPVPALQLDKTAGDPVDVNDSGLVDAGDTIRYAFTVRNAGNVPVDSVQVVDPMVGSITCPDDALSPGQSTECTADEPYVVTPSDEAAGSVLNTAAATGSDPDDQSVTSAPDSTSTPVVAGSPALAVEKVAGDPVDVNGSGLVDAGDTIAYSFTVTNTGDVPVRDVAVDDPRAGATTCGAPRLGPGESTSCTANAVYVVTDADERAGEALNRATATGIDPDGDAVRSEPDSTTTAVATPRPELKLLKTASPPVDVNESGLVDAGDTIAYAFTVTNTGNVPVRFLAVNDPLVGSVTCAQTLLAPGEPTDCVADTAYVVTAGDERAGLVLNTATATAADPDGEPLRSEPDRVSVAVDTPRPELSLDKAAGDPVDANDSGITDAGDTILFSFTVTNTGNVPVSDVRVADDLLAAVGTGVTCDAESLAVGGSTSCVADAAYVVTQADEDGPGVVVNVATAQGADPDGESVVSDPDATSTPVTAGAAALTLEKVAGSPVDVNDSGITDAGDTIAYSFTVTNDGNVPVSSVTIEDPLAGDVTCAPGRLAPGESAQCVPAEPYVVTGADEQAGEVVNTATASGVDPDGTRVRSNDDSTTTPVDIPAPSLLVEKTAGDPVDVNGSGITDAGDTIGYSFTVTNSGNVPLRAVGIDDDLLTSAGIAVSCEATRLGVGETTTCTSEDPYVIVVSDEAAGSVDNEARATAQDPDGSRIASAPDRTSTPVVSPAPSLELSKRGGDPVDVNDSGITDAGDTIRYSFTVTNTGNVPVRDVAVVDRRLADAGISVTCESARLPVGASTACAAQAPYVVTEADEAAGVAANVATASAVEPDGGDVVSAPDGTRTPVDTPRPQLEVEKTAADPVDVNESGITDAGDTIRYSFTVTNAGNVPVSDLSVVDELLAEAGITITCTPTGLAPGGEAQCTTSASYVVTAADETRQVVSNTATATGTDPDEGGVVSDPDSTNTPVTESAAILSLDKVAGDPVDVNGSGLVDAGDTIAYSFTLTNDGNVPLTGIGVTDALVGPVTCEETSLAVGASTACTADRPYVVTEADERAGGVVNTAVARGTDPDRSPVSSPEDRTTTTVDQPAPSLVVEKVAGEPTDANDSGLPDAGDRVRYSFTVTNTGTVPVRGVEVVDPLLAENEITVTCEASTLAPGAFTTCTADAAYQVTERDEAAGAVDNTARARGADPDGEPVLSDPDRTRTPLAATASSLLLDKVAGDPVDRNGSGLVDAGDTIAYSFIVTNTGNVPVQDLAVVDDLLDRSGITVTCETARLGAGASTTCAADADYIVTEADERAGDVVNSASARGTDTDGGRVVSALDETLTIVDAPRPGLAVEKQAGEPVDVNGSGITDAGDTIAYSFTVTNTGDVPVRGVRVVDDLLADAGIAVTCEADSLEVGGSTTCAAQAAYVVTQDDEDGAGAVVNTARVQGDDPDGEPVVSDPDSTSTPVGAGAAALVLDKAAGDPVDVNDNGLVDAGDTITYSFTVTNTGNVPVDAIAVDDPLVAAVTCEDTRLAPGDATTCSAEPYVVTADDERAGEVVNTAGADGTDPDGERVESAEDSTRTPLTAPAPGLELVKTAAPVDEDGDDRVDEGERIRYFFTVTNTGNVVLREVSVSDPLIGQVDCGRTTLAPGESVRCEASRPYEVTAQDADRGEVVNNAEASSAAPGGVTVSDADSVRTSVVTGSQLELVKEGLLRDRDGDDRADAGEQVLYRFTVTNVGDDTVDAVAVSDPMLVRAGVEIECPRTTLDGGASMVCTALYTVTAQDVADGQVSNTASVVGENGVIESAPATAALPGDDTPDEADGGDDTPRAPGGDPDASGAGVLPDTGGPSLLLLLLGLVLVVAGGWSIRLGRRRKA